MINFYGIFQLVKVVKIGETKKKDLVVYFTAASNRAEDVSDFKLFKVFGKNAEKFINNLEKKGDGYKSRRMMIDGYVETYVEDRTVTCSASVKKDKFPAKYGELIKDFKVETSTTIKIDRDSYVINHFQFLDKKGNGSTKYVDKSDDEDEPIYLDDDDDSSPEDEEETLMKTVASKLSSNKNSDKNITKSVMDGENKLNYLKSLITETTA